MPRGRARPQMRLVPRRQLTSTVGYPHTSHRWPRISLPPARRQPAAARGFRHVWQREAMLSSVRFRCFPFWTSVLVPFSRLLYNALVINARNPLCGTDTWTLLIAPGLPWLDGFQGPLTFLSRGIQETGCKLTVPIQTAGLYFFLHIYTTARARALLRPSLGIYSAMKSERKGYKILRNSNCTSTGLKTRALCTYSYKNIHKLPTNPLFPK